MSSNMEKEFIPYELAVKLKELGFDEYCMGACYYEFKDRGTINMLLHTPDSYEPCDGVKAPLFQQAFRWFREKHNLFGCIDLHSCIPPHWFVRIDNIVTNDYVFHSEDEQKKFTTYEESELACLVKLIEIAKGGEQ